MDLVVAYVFVSALMFVATQDDLHGTTLFLATFAWPAILLAIATDEVLEEMREHEQSGKE